MWIIQRLRLTLSLHCLLQVCAANFTFTSYSDATQCDDFQVSWTGGSPPFRLTILPSYTPQTSVDIPDNSFSNNKGTFTRKMPLKAGNQTVLIMSDSTGFATGGVSPLITVGDSKTGAACDTSPKVDFTFIADGALRQCEQYVFQDYGQATQPIQITGVIPGGSTFVLNPPNGSKSFTWLVDVAAGTELLFFMTDSLGRQGGTTSLATVEHSEDSSCVGTSSPASTSNPPSLVATSTTSTSTQTGTASTSPSGSRKTGPPIADIVAPVVAVAVLLVCAFIWYCRRRRRRGGVKVLGRKFQHPEVDLTKGDSDTPQHMRDIGSPTSAAPFLHGRSLSADGATTLGSYSPPLPTSANTSQFPEFLPPASVYSDSYQGHQYGVMSAYGSSHGSSSQYGGTPAPTVAYAGSTGMRSEVDIGARRKAAEAGVLTPPGQHAPAQFILHTDIEDSVPPPIPVIELPPQYSERRAGTPVPSGGNLQPHAGEPHA
ncbi:hypothetical protein OH76DRAFT_712831 [Lentinus brumalis]|uniref:Alphaherpesvirus glycoprotein E domain-containing protein n=1 Tax=Lentinus brumalis TaxID=2498619 RepID=A0A371D5G3_9APHY|nr:hypothetical protein OH76DRAFT_712831 [Polyporus brumalis]